MHSEILNSLRKPRQVYFVAFEIFYLEKQPPLAKKRLKFYPLQLVCSWNINVLLMRVSCSPLKSNVKLPIISFLLRQAERVGQVQPEKEKAPGNISVLKET